MGMASVYGGCTPHASEECRSDGRAGRGESAGACRNEATRHSGALTPHDRHEAHAASRRAAQVVREPELRVLDLPRARLAAQLEPHLVHHAEPARADRVAEALEPAVGIHRLRAVAVEAAVEHVLPALPARREAHVLHQDQLGRA